MINLIELDTVCRRAEQGLAGGSDKPCRSPEKYKGKLDFDEYASLGARLLIPSIHLFGTQLLSDYELGKRKTVEAKLKRCGVECLKEHPIPVCALPDRGVLTLAMVDGHHRTRYGGLAANRMIPSVVYTPEQLVNILNQNKVYDKPVSVEWLVDDLNRAVVDTIESFAISLPDVKNPKTIPVSDIERLKRMYPAF